MGRCDPQPPAPHLPKAALFPCAVTPPPPPCHAALPLLSVQDPTPALASSLWTPPPPHTHVCAPASQRLGRGAREPGGSRGLDVQKNAESPFALARSERQPRPREVQASRSLTHRTTYAWSHDVMDVCASLSPSHSLHRSAVFCQDCPARWPLSEAWGHGWQPPDPSHWLPGRASAESTARESHRILLVSWVETTSTTCVLRAPGSSAQGPTSRAGARSPHPVLGSPESPAIRPSAATQAAVDRAGDCSLGRPPTHEGDPSQLAGSDHGPPTAWSPPTELESPSSSPRRGPDDASGDASWGEEGIWPVSTEVSSLGGPREPPGDMASSGGEGKSSEVGLGLAPLSAGGGAGGGGA